tara:strand:+ start:362 stop:928 length:567 start_codon:yes stop_codon:yes gene_type:complete
MPEVKIRALKGTALTQSEMDDNLRFFFNSASVSSADGTLSLFSSESSARQKEIDTNPHWFNHSGSADIGVTSVTGSLVVSDTITAQTFNTELVSSSILYDSGSTKFGDTLDDVHSFTGSLELSGSQEISGSIVLENTSSTVATVDSGYILLTEVSESLNFADDTAAAAGGIPLGGLYRNGNFIQIRLT